MKPWLVALGAIVVFAAVYVAFPSKAFSQTTYFKGPYGQDLGSSYTLGNTTYLTAPNGQPLGSATTYGAPPPQVGLPVPSPMVVEPLRIEPIRPIEPIQPLRLQ